MPVGRSAAELRPGRSFLQARTNDGRRTHGRSGLATPCRQPAPTWASRSLFAPPAGTTGNIYELYLLDVVGADYASVVRTISPEAPDLYFDRNVFPGATEIWAGATLPLWGRASSAWRSSAERTMVTMVRGQHGSGCRIRKHQSDHVDLVSVDAVLKMDRTRCTSPVFRAALPDGSVSA